MIVISGEVMHFTDAKPVGKTIFTAAIEDVPLHGSIHGLLISSNKTLVVADFKIEESTFSFNFHEMGGKLVGTIDVEHYERGCSGFWSEPKNLGIIFGNIMTSDKDISCRHIMDALGFYEERFKEIKLYV